MSETLRGVIVSKQVVNIGAKRPENENDPGLGAGVGALAGGGAASYIGKGSGKLWAMGAGALAGGIAGHFAERALTDQEGFLYTVQLDSGRTISLSQGAEPNMAVGQRVLVITPSRPSGREAYTGGDKNLSRGRIVPDTSR
jgi:outer membrane lipoprotein SlyB